MALTLGGPEMLIRRHDYHVDIAGSFPAAQYLDRIVDVQGFKIPTRRRAYLLGPDLKPVQGLLLVSIDLSKVRQAIPWYALRRAHSKGLLVKYLTGIDTSVLDCCKAFF